MKLLIVYDIELEDGRTGMTWTEDENNEEYYYDFATINWPEVMGLIEEEFGSVAVKYKWEFEEQDEQDEDY
jgi:hypothetical protein